MRIAVSMRIVENQTYAETRDAVSHDWITFLQRFDVTPILVPNVLDDPTRFLELLRVEGLILTNGEDVGATLPPENGALKSPHRHRDATECSLASFALERHLPIFGVCRGFQFLNVYFGGSVTRDISHTCQGAGEHVTRAGHPVDVVDPRFRGVLGVSRLTVNSFHTSGVTSGNLAPGLRPFAVASGGIVEGWYHSEFDVLAIQWHPERASFAPERDASLLHSWLNLVRIGR